MYKNILNYKIQTEMESQSIIWQHESTKYEKTKNEKIQILNEQQEFISSTHVVSFAIYFNRNYFFILKAKNFIYNITCKKFATHANAYIHAIYGLFTLMNTSSEGNFRVSQWSRDIYVAYIFCHFFSSICKRLCLIIEVFSLT